MELNTAEILKKVRQIEIKTGKLVSETFSGQYQSIFKGRGIEFSEVREYLPGDDIRTIDWNVTARLMKPFVKKYEEERELTLLVACDVSGSQHFGTSAKFKNEISAELSALFLFSALKNNDKTGLYLFSDRTELYIPPKKGKNHILRIVRELLAFKPKNKLTSISSALRNINHLLKRKAIIILISDFLDENFEKSIIITEKKHDLIPVVVNDRFEKSIRPAPAILNYENAETGERNAMDLSDAAALAGYAEKRKKEAESLKKLFNSQSIDFIEIDSDKDVLSSVVKFFKNRKLKIKAKV